MLSFLRIASRGRLSAFSSTRMTYSLQVEQCFPAMVTLAPSPDYSGQLSECSAHNPQVPSSSQCVLLPLLTAISRVQLTGQGIIIAWYLEEQQYTILVQPHLIFSLSLRGRFLPLLGGSTSKLLPVCKQLFQSCPIENASEPDSNFLSET